MNPVLIIGNITCDILIQVEKLPKLQDDVRIEAQSMYLGGCAYNVANLFHLFHLPYKLISVVGTGIYGDFIKEQLKMQGYKHRLYSKEMHGCCYCFIDSSKERSFAAYHGIEYSFKSEWMNPYKGTSFSCAYVCGLDIEEDAGNAIIDYLETLACPIVFAPSPRCSHISKRKLNRMYAMHPILHLNAKEAIELSEKDSVEEALEGLYALTNNLVVITLGDKGSVAKSSDEIIYVEAKKCEIIDTLGAGDAHASSVIMKLIEGKSLKEILTYANKMSAKIVGKQGATFTKEEFSKIF